MPETRFPLGRVVATPGALKAMEHHQHCRRRFSPGTEAAIGATWTPPIALKTNTPSSRFAAPLGVYAS